VQCAPVSILPKKGDVRKYAYLDILLAYSEFCTLGWFNTADRMCNWTGRKVHSKYGHSATGNFPFLSHSGIFQPTLWPNYLKEPASMFAATLNQYSMRTATVQINMHDERCAGRQDALHFDLQNISSFT